MDGVSTVGPVALRTCYEPETLASGNFDEFGELGSNHQTLTFQSKARGKATKQNKRLQVKQCKAK